MTKKKTFQYKIAYYDETGKRRGKTFSAPTAKEARLKAAEWEMNQPKDKHPSMTVLNALENYIDMKEAALSPSTIRGYERVKKVHIEEKSIGSVRVCDLTVEDVQAWVNQMIVDGKSPKTVANNFGLFKSAVSSVDKTINLDSVTLPQKEKYMGHTPSDAEVRAIMDYASKLSDKDLYIAILLAAFGPLRRSEVCALTDKDVRGNTIIVSKDMVQNKDGSWVIKTTKTVESTREIEYPAFVIEAVKGIEGNLVKSNPEALHHRFRRAVKSAGLEKFRFHDLRHYGASIMHALGVPDIYIMQRGGWSTDYVMKKIYISAMDEEKRKQTDKINDHFSNL